MFSQSMMVSMYFAVSWLEPRLEINDTAQEWIEDRTGPKDVSSSILYWVWGGETFNVLHIYGNNFTASKRISGNLEIPVVP